MELIKDKKHWLGWVLTTLAVILTLNYFKINITLSIALILLAVVVGIDLIKHKIKWQ